MWKFFHTKTNKMKKLIVFIMIAGLTLTCAPTQLIAAPAAYAASAATESAEANALLARLHEIKTLSKTNLSSPAKKELRSEVRSIKKQLSGIGGGVYISVGALIIIILLLIILL
jgi:hypothetical protein